MGTPDFAVPALEALVDEGHDVAAVITAPDKPAGRGMKLQQSAVKQFALSRQIQVLQPEKLKDPEFNATLRNIAPEVQVVVAFRMLPEMVWNLPPLGTLNVHASLLPDYRGAAPINWAIINGETETGVTTFRLKHQIDTGDILLQESTQIGAQETAGELYERLKHLGAKLLIRTLDKLAEGSVNPLPQSQAIHNDHPKHAPKIFTADCEIDWSQNTESIYNRIRGLSPSPGAFTRFNGQILKIYFATKESTPPQVAPGEYETDKKTFIRFASADGYIVPVALQLEGKKKMEIAEFLKGYRFN
jgi:methionyl-tRNA formyltransferase